MFKQTKKVKKASAGQQGQVQQKGVLLRPPEKPKAAPT